MRTRMMILIGALLVASATYAQAQDSHAGPGTAPQPAVSTFTPQFGNIDFGYRGRRSRVTRPATTAIATCGTDRSSTSSASPRRTRRTAFRAEANNVGYRDQRYSPTCRASASSRPRSSSTRTRSTRRRRAGYFTGAGSGTLTINDAAQTAIQTNPLNAETALATYGNNYNIESRRDLANFNMTYTAARDLDVKVQLRNTNRSGTNLQDFGFGSSPGNMMVLDMPVPVNDRTTDVRTKLEWANQRGLLAVGYDASWSDQRNAAFTFDNPQRVSDSADRRAGIWPGRTDAEQQRQHLQRERVVPSCPATRGRARRSATA